MVLAQESKQDAEIKKKKTFGRYDILQDILKYYISMKIIFK